MSKTVRQLFSAEKRTLLPVLMDGLAVLICSLPLWIIFLATSDTYSLGGDLMPPSLLTIWTLLGYIILTAGFSFIAIRHMRRRTRPGRSKRSKSLTVLGIAIAIVVGTVPMPFFNDFTLKTLWDAFVSSSLLAVPAALRLTAPMRSIPKKGVADPDAMRRFGVEPGSYDGSAYRWRQEP